MADQYDPRNPVRKNTTPDVMTYGSRKAPDGDTTIDEPRNARITPAAQEKMNEANAANLAPAAGQSLGVSSNNVSRGTKITITGTGYPEGTKIHWHWAGPPGVTPLTLVTLEMHDHLHGEGFEGNEGDVVLAEDGELMTAEVSFDSPGDYHIELAGKKKDAITVTVT